MTMLDRVCLSIREVLEDGVVVSSQDWDAAVELPRELFTPEEFAKLDSAETLTGLINRTRFERKLIVAGPFTIGE